jgi:hypothetical protein
MLLVALGFGFLGVETHGRPMALGDETATVVSIGAASSGRGAIVTGRIEGKASLDVRCDFTGVSHRTSIDGE